MTNRVTLTGVLVKHVGHSLRPGTEYAVPAGRVYGTPRLQLWCENCKARVWDEPVGAQRESSRSNRVDGPVAVGDLEFARGDKVTGVSNDGRTVVTGHIAHFERDGGVIYACVGYERQRVGMFATLLDVTRLSIAHPELPCGRA
jgi:hypothetical protein